MYKAIRQPTMQQSIAKKSGAAQSTIAMILNGSRKTMNLNLALIIAAHTGKSARNYLSKKLWPLLNNKRRKSA